MVLLLGIPSVLSHTWVGMHRYCIASKHMATTGSLLSLSAL